MASFGNFIVVLDACVLFPASLRDILLRLAETPRMYMPKWTDEIWQEVLRNLVSKHNMSSQKTDHLIGQVRTHFPECWVEGYQPLIQLMKNDSKDRHVTAAAVKCGAQVIVTSNLRDFAQNELSPWNLEAQHPDDFLLHQYDLNPAVIVSKLNMQAADISFTLADLLLKLRNSVPVFASKIAQELEIEL